MIKQHFVCALYHIASGMCHLAQAIKGDADPLLKGMADRSTIEAVKHILEMVFHICFVNLKTFALYDLVIHILFCLFSPFCLIEWKWYDF